MKTKNILMILGALTLLSCNTKSNNDHASEQEEHEDEGVVILNELQRAALDLQLGAFQMRNLTTVVKTNGQLEVPPSASAEVTAIIGGNVREIMVFHGDRVRKGQVLAILEHPDYITLQEDFSESSNKLDFLNQEYDRQRELFENNVGAGRDFQQVKSEFNTTKAKYQGLKARLELLNINPDDVLKGNISNTVKLLAPINGYINEVNIKIGTYAEPKDELFGISNLNEIHADFMVYENDVHLVKEGQKIHFKVSNRPGEELLATIFAIGKEFESNTRAVHIHASLKKNPGNLIPGMYIAGHIHTDDTFTRTLPNDAVVTEGTKSYIFIQDELSTTETEDDHRHEPGEDHENEVEESSDSHTDHEESQSMTFRMIEVITGKQDEGYTEIKLLESLPDDTRIVMNSAYYLLADLKKEETEHEH